MYYIANWGSVRLAFRFPKNLIDVTEIEPYCVDYYLTCDVAGEFIVISFDWNHEEGFDYWIEGEGDLAGLLPLREAILRQDYRVLYLAWLLAAEDEYEVAEETLEPPVPPGLRELSASLREFENTFAVDSDLLEAAATASPSLQQAASPILQETAVTLSSTEQQSWLRRLANDEPRLGVKFQRFLRQKLPPGTQPARSARRTVAELRLIADEARQQEKARREAAAAAKRKREMAALAANEEETWTTVDQLIQEGKAKPYDEAVHLLINLHDLAVYQGTETTYGERLRRLRTMYSRRSALLRRLNKVDLL
jgi:hypothetical protein